MSTKWVTVAEATDRLPVGRRTLYDGIAAGSIPHRRVGRRVLVAAAWVDGQEEAAPTNSNASMSSVDHEEIVAATVRATLRELGVALLRATAPDAESGTVLDLYARDDVEGRHGR
jgi:excisionase family DNA binding protein